MSFFVLIILLLVAQCAALYALQSYKRYHNIIYLFIGLIIFGLIIGGAYYMYGSNRDFWLIFTWCALAIFFILSLDVFFIFI